MSKRKQKENYQKNIAMSKNQKTKKN